MGGALSFASSILVKDVDCAVCFYGIPPQQLAHPKDLSKPVQFHFGDKDQSPGFSDIEAANKLRDSISGIKVVELKHSSCEYKQVERSGVLAEFHRYEDGNHAFMNEEAPAYPYNVIMIDVGTSSKLGKISHAKLFKALFAAIKCVDTLV